MTMTGADNAQIRDVLRRYDRAVSAADATAVAELYSAYAVHFPDRHPEAYGTEIEERYRWLFNFERPQPGHQLRELVATANVTVAATVQRHHPSSTTGTPYLFVFTCPGGQWKILASIQGSRTFHPITRPNHHEVGKSDLLRQVQARLTTTNATMLATLSNHPWQS
ncbi:YybH family protein [Nocardia alni]|uniref:YybH family protein n=1 Tax=Nocardia alni TaxID=2815723 RepID=UPI001C223371|nr:nuclear transport factor 2 family protein [Nocardia alni]